MVISGKLLNKLWHIHTMEHYITAAKINVSSCADVERNPGFILFMKTIELQNCKIGRYHVG